MNQFSKRVVVHYLVAIAAVAAVTLVRYLFEIAGLTDATYLLFAGGIVLAAWVGGFGPGLVATLTSIIVIGGLLVDGPSRFSLFASELPEMLMFLAQGLFISALGHARLRAKRGEDESYRLLERRVEERTDELQQLNDELEERARQHEHDRELLHEANHRLQQSNRELQDFASVASHDLQEPLRKIRAFGDRLVQRFGDDFPGGAHDYLDRMLNAAERMQVLINDLLTFSRVTSKGQAFVETDLDRIAREVVSDLEARIEQEEARVDLQPLPTLDADPLQMRQLLQNLISNALKFRREGAAPEVRVWAEETQTMDPANGEETRPAVRLCVADNGIGFEEKYLDRIFNVFQRLHGRQSYAGTGIGLAVCRKIAHRHGGEITARSEPGTGATFMVTLPLEHQHPDEHDPAQTDHDSAGR